MKTKLGFFGSLLIFSSLSEALLVFLLVCPADWSRGWGLSVLDRSHHHCCSRDYGTGLLVYPWGVCEWTKLLMPANLWTELLISRQHRQEFLQRTFLRISKDFFLLELRPTLKWNSPFIRNFVSWFEFALFYFGHVPSDGFESGVWRSHSDGPCVLFLYGCFVVALFFFKNQLVEFFFPTGVR